MSNSLWSGGVDPSSLDPAILANLPAASPPDGEKPNFSDPRSLEGLGRACIYTFLPIMICFVVLRIYAKARVSRSLGIDDWTCTTAALGTIVYCVLILEELGNPLGPHQWNVHFLQLTDSFVKMMHVKINLYVALTLITKVGILFQFFRYFRPSLVARYMIWIGFSLIVLFYVSTIIANIILCVPRAGEHWTSNTTEQRCSEPEYHLSITQGIFNVISDLYLLAIPLIQVMGLHISKSRKLGLAAVFLTGFLACVFSIISSVFRFAEKGHKDLTWTVVPIYAFSVAELCVGITCSCIPVIFVLFKSTFHTLRTKISSIQYTLFKRSGREASDRRESWPLPAVVLSPHEKELPPIPKGTLQTLRGFIKGVFTSSVSAGEATMEGDDVAGFTNVSDFHMSKDDYHVHLRDVESPRRV